MAEHAMKTIPPLIVAFFAISAAVHASGPPPNVAIACADDLGYGDLSAYGATRFASTPGERAPSVLPGDARLIVEPRRTTLASVLKRAGYHTGVVGRWHLSLGDGRIDWNGDIRPGPGEIGFDESFLVPATGDRVPCVYVEKGRVVGLDPKDPIEVSYDHAVGDEPTGKAHPELLKMHPSHGHDMAIVNRISGPLRGGKYSAFEAGTRVPMIVRWPGRVKPGVSDALVGQVDLVASSAALTGQALARQDAPDSVDVLGALLGDSRTGRDSFVEQAGALSLVSGRWKLISPHEGRKVNPETNTELGNDPQPQLYDLSVDLGERRNVTGEHPEVVRELTERLARIRHDGRSRP